MVWLRILVCIFIIIGSSSASFGKITGVETKGWEDDVFLVYFGAGGYQEATLDSISSTYNCTSRYEISLRAVRFELPTGSDEEYVVANMEQQAFFGVLAADLDYLFSIVDDRDAE